MIRVQLGTLGRGARCVSNNTSRRRISLHRRVRGAVFITTEALVVSPNRPGISTAQHLIPNDDGTITGATSNAGGTITFNLYSPTDATCSGAPALTQTVNVSGNNTYNTTNTTFVASADGTWRCWSSTAVTPTMPGP